MTYEERRKALESEHDQLRDKAVALTVEVRAVEKKLGAIAAELRLVRLLDEHARLGRPLPDLVEPEVEHRQKRKVKGEAAPRPRREAIGGSTARKVLEALAAGPKTVAELLTGLADAGWTTQSAHPYNVVYSTLTVLTRREKVKKDANGRYWVV